MHMGQINRYTYGTDIHTYGTDRQPCGTCRHTHGTDIHTDTHMGQGDRHTDRLTYGTDIQTDTHMGQAYSETQIWDRHKDRHKWPTKNSFYARNFFVFAPILGLGFFQTPRMHGESVHVLRFKIGP